MLIDGAQTGHAPDFLPAGTVPPSRERPKNNGPGAQDLYSVNLHKIEDDELPRDRHERRRDHQFDVNHVVAKIERDVQEDIDDDEHRQKCAEGDEKDGRRTCP